MPGDALTFGDLIDKLDHLEIVCPKCGRQGRYLVHKLATERGHHVKIPDWIGEMTATCPRGNAPGLADPCAARCPGLVSLNL